MPRGSLYDQPEARTSLANAAQFASSDTMKKVAEKATITLTETKVTARQKRDFYLAILPPTNVL